MDVVSILEKMQEMGLVRLNKISGSYYSIYCPIHSNGQERRPSCGVLLHEEVRNGQTYPEGLTHCFTCGQSWTLPELITQILKDRNISGKTGFDWLKENVPGFEGDLNFDRLLPVDVVQNLNAKYAVDYIKLKTNKQPKYISEEELASYRFTVDYMYERRLTDDVISRFDIGVDLNFVPDGRVRKVPCITFPVRDKTGGTLFIYRRSIQHKNFFMPAGLEKPLYGIYELPKNTSTVILCESIFNALTCYVYGYPALALFGTGTVSQLNALKQLGVKEFIIGTDPDDAGERGAKKLKRALSSIAIVRRMHLPSGKDINDLEKDEFLEVLENRI